MIHDSTPESPSARSSKTTMKRWWNQRRFDLLEVIVASATVGLVMFLAARQSSQPLETSDVSERTTLAEKYGPARNSEHEEEWIVRDFFGDRRDGVFVDVGANHYRAFSNTYYLETTLGWSGLAIEPQVMFAADYRSYRPRTRFLPFFVSESSDQLATMYYLKSNPLVTSSDKTFTDRFGAQAAAFEAPTITLDDLLVREGIDRFDFMSMDIELAEPRALKGFDIERFRPELVCIEAHPEVRQQILDYFAQHHYVVVGKYLRADQTNLYFAPASGHSASPM
jgi:FkbM family methyltransferase